MKTRFWAKVQVAGPDECWVWTAAKANGYGMFRVGSKGSKTTTAHRVSYELANGPTSSDLVICHRCDNRACVNPAHLFAGTQAENIEDMVGKARQSRGERHRPSKLTEVAVREMRRKHAAGDSMKALGREFGVDAAWVSQIVNRRWWRHVD